MYISGLHGDTYIDNNRLYVLPDEISKLARGLAGWCLPYKVDAVVGPAIGGVILSQWFTYHLSQLTRRKVYSTYVEKAGDSQILIFKRGFNRLLEGKQVLIVDDVLMTGGSLRQTIELTRAVGAEIQAAAVLFNREGLTANDLDIPALEVLVDMPLPSWPASECHLCRDLVPINIDIGHGREFLEYHQRPFREQ